MTAVQRRAILDLVDVHFPLAKTSSQTVASVNAVLEGVGCRPSNTLFGQSVCADEINHESGDITEMFGSRWGEVSYLCYGPSIRK